MAPGPCDDADNRRKDLSRRNRKGYCVRPGNVDRQLSGLDAPQVIELSLDLLIGDRHVLGSRGEQCRPTSYFVANPNLANCRGRSRSP